MIVKNCLCNVLHKCLIKMKSTWRHRIKEQTPQLTLLYFARTFGSSHWRCSINKPVLKDCKLSTGNSCMGFLFIKVAGLKFYVQLYLKETAIKVFSCEYYKVNTYLKNICKWLLFYCLNGSLLDGPKGSRSRLYDDIRL